MQAGQVSPLLQLGDQGLQELQLLLSGKDGDVVGAEHTEGVCQLVAKQPYLQGRRERERESGLALFADKILTCKEADFE